MAMPAPPPQSRRRAARQNRLGQSEYQPARPGHLPHTPRAPPQHRRPWCDWLLERLIEGGLLANPAPRIPTLVGLRRSGYMPEALQLFAERIGVTKSDSWIDYSTIEGCLRETLDGTAPRAMAVLNPIKLVLTKCKPC